MGRYVPPEHEGVTSGNALLGKHALGSRARKSSQGILTVRFEMPYPIWCTTCPKPTIIGQGVRFNAEKKKVGNYYTTPIFSFRMKHTPCGGIIEIRTDPKNTAYVVVEGARKRDTGEDKVLDGDVCILTAEEREARRGDAFASLEGKVEDRQRLYGAKERLEELQAAQQAQWEDPYTRNSELRRAFRIGRKAREKEAVITGNLKDKMSLGIDLVPEHEDDIRRAGFVEFGVVSSETALAKAVARPLFPVEEPQTKLKTKEGKKSSRRLKIIEEAEKRKADLAKEIRGNTRARLDPFLNDRVVEKSAPKVHLGIKRKRSAIGDTVEPEILGNPLGHEVTSTGLVDYDSD